MSVDAIRDNDWLVEDSPDDGIPVRAQIPWKILIVDDEPDVHSVTRLALRNIEYHGRKLELISAYSASEAFEILSHTVDIAVILLDVVMETDDAGLRLVHRIRQELGNQLCRIVLRTGQPGQAPEQEVIVSYDINDYKSKTELTTQKLFTTIIASLRSFESLWALENHRQGLHKIIKASSNLYRIQSLREFASGLLKQINALLNIGLDGSLCLVYRPDISDSMLQVIAATGCYEHLSNSDFLPKDMDLNDVVFRAIREKRHIYEHPNDVLYVPVQQKREFVVFLCPSLPLNEVERSLLEVFCDRMSLAFDNLWLNDQLKGSQAAAVTLLASLSENLSTDQIQAFADTRQRVEGITDLLRADSPYSQDITPQFQQQIGLAYLLHDLGKLTIDPKILNKPTALTEEERAEVQKHAMAGNTLLMRAVACSDEPDFLTLGAEIAAYHHERFDGKGYPNGLSGHEIPLAARIAAVCDVFEALRQPRPYKSAWEESTARQYMEENAGGQFDPVIVRAFLKYMTSR